MRATITALTLVFTLALLGGCSKCDWWLGKPNACTTMPAR